MFWTRKPIRTKKKQKGHLVSRVSIYRVNVLSNHDFRIFHSYYFRWMFDRPKVINWFNFLINNPIVSPKIIIITITISISCFYDTCKYHLTNAIFIQIKMYMKKKRKCKKYYFIVLYCTLIMTMRIASV